MIFLWPYNNNMQASSIYTLEIAVFNFRSALIAANAGASRIELCENAAEGKTTPNYGTLKLVREKIQLPVFPKKHTKNKKKKKKKNKKKKKTQNNKLCK